MALPQSLLDESALLYRKVVSHGYMEHEAIANALVELVDRLPPIRRVLDLGSGDAELMKRFGRRREIGEYLAVDRSAESLDRAKAKLQDIAAEMQVFQADMLDFLWGSSTEFDLILVGYAVNALDADEKRALLRLARTRLSPQGVLLVYDAFRQPGESRQDCLDGYARIVEEDWSDLHDSEVAAIKTHVNRCCFPEDFETFVAWAVRADLRLDPELSWTGHNPYHKLIALRRA